MDLLQLARHLGADIHVVARLQRAGGGDDIFDVATLNGGELETGRGVAVAGQGSAVCPQYWQEVALGLCVA